MSTNFAYRNGTCAGCYLIKWVQTDNLLCYDCRQKMANQQQDSTALVKAQTDPHMTALAEYTSPEATTFLVRTAENLALAAEAVADLKARKKALEEARLSITRPMREAAAQVSDLFRPPQSAVDTALELWSSKILEYRQYVAGQQAEANVVAEAAAARGDYAGAKQSLAIAVAVDEGVPGQQVTKRWSFEVINAGIVPTDFTKPDEAAIRTEMFRQLREEHVDKPVMPGVRFFQVDGLTSKRVP